MMSGISGPGIYFPLLFPWTLLSLFDLSCTIAASKVFCNHHSSSVLEGNVHVTP